MWICVCLGKKTFQHKENKKLSDRLCAVESTGVAELEKLRTQVQALHRVQEEAHCFCEQVSCLEEELELTRHELEKNREVG